MKKYFSIQVVLICLISSNFVFANGNSPANNDVQTASVYWNFRVLDVIEPIFGQEAYASFNILTNSIKKPTVGNELFVSFIGTASTPITMTVTKGTGVYTMDGTGNPADKPQIDVTVLTASTFGNDASDGIVSDGKGQADCKITVNSIQSGSALGMFIWETTVTVNYIQ